jgi:hypothetical protein
MKSRSQVCENARRESRNDRWRNNFQSSDWFISTPTFRAWIHRHLDYLPHIQSNPSWRSSSISKPLIKIFIFRSHVFQWLKCCSMSSKMSTSAPAPSYALPTTLPHEPQSSPRRSWKNRLNFLPSNHPNSHSSVPEEELNRSNTNASLRSKHVAKWWKVRLFRGMINDVRRRAPYYWSDWADAWDYRVVPATVYMYFAKYALPPSLGRSKETRDKTWKG